MKKIVILLLIFTLALTMISCSGNDTGTEVNEPTNNVEENTTEASTEETQENTTETSTEETQENTTETSAENTNEEADETTEEATEETEEAQTQPDYEFVPIDVTQLSDENRPVVTIEMEDGQKIVLKLVPEVAPNTVNSFISLIDQGYYDGLIFHRIISGFMIQGGDPEGTGRGGPGYTIKDEFYVVEDLTVTYLSHARGILSMAKTAAPNSAGSQFFIMHEDGPFLDGQYAAFGFVAEGMDVVDQLAAVETEGDANKPVEDVVIKTITVELNGYELEAPEIIQ